MKPVSRKAILIATLFVLFGCAGKQRPVTSTDLSSYPHFIALHYPPLEIFTMDTGAGAAPALALGILGIAAVAIERQEAARRVQEQRLEDPSVRVKDRLVNALQANFQLTNVRPVSSYPQNVKIALETYSEAIRNRNIEAALCVPSPGFVCSSEGNDIRLSRLSLNDTLKEAFPNGIVLEVQTRRWRLENKQRVMYDAVIRLFSLSDSVVVWRRYCRGYAEVDPSEVPNFKERTTPHPTMGIEPTVDQVMLEELEANNGKLLKAKVRQAADACADSLLRAHLDIVSQPKE